MSEIWLVLAVGCLFFAVVLIGVFVDQSMAERRRALRMLESQVVTGSGASAEPANLREQELSEDFGTRVLVPIVSRAAHVAKRITPIDTRDRLAKKLVLAGSPAGWDAERVLAFKIIGAVLGFVGALALVNLLDFGRLIQLVIIGLLTFVGFIAPDSPGGGTTAGHPQDVVGYPRPPHDQRGGRTVAERCHRTGRA